MPGEIVPSREFYDYEAKYTRRRLEAADSGAADRGADATGADSWRSQLTRRSTARAWRGSIFCSPATAASLYLNEVNTIPGFTTISMYSKMWAASGAAVPGAPRSADRARHRAARRQAAAADEHVTTVQSRRRRLQSDDADWLTAGCVACCLLLAFASPAHAALTEATAARRHLRHDPRRPLRTGRCPARSRPVHRLPTARARRSASCRCGGRFRSTRKAARSTAVLEARRFDHRGQRGLDPARAAAR